MANRRTIGILGGLLGLGTGASSLENSPKQQTEHTSHTPTGTRHHADEPETSRSTVRRTSNENPEEPRNEAPDFASIITPDRLNEESAELKQLFTADPEVSERYFDLVSQLTSAQLADGATRFAVPGTDFDITLRPMHENGKSWITCEGLGCVDYGETFIDGKMQMTQIGGRGELGPRADTLSDAANNPALLEDFQHLLAGYARADLSGTTNPMADTDTALDDSQLLASNGI